MASSMKSRITENSTPVPWSGCWLWDGRVDRRGYGVIDLPCDDGRHRPRFAHRVSYEAFKGPLGDSIIRHDCDVPGCVNPDHLRAGTVAENQRDMVIRGRSTRGEKNPRAKLTATQAEAIRNDRRKQTDIAADYGLHPTYVSLIQRGHRWAYAA